MSSIQERLQLKRVPLDKWSVKEKLCLANLVSSSCSGENWNLVSRSLKLLCQANRPSDWFSQKCCAAQYGKLLENVETPKRKKRTASEREAVVETPSESILRNLTQERISELKKLIHEEQQLYMKVKDEVSAVQTSDENKLREMWNQIEMEKKQKEKDQQIHQQWLKEREERKQELERAWRPTTNLSNPQNSPTQSPVSQKSSTLTLKIKSEDMEVDEVTSKPGTSPLLTSLLKSPSPAPNSTTTSTTPIIHTPTSVRNLAPTITNLLQSPDVNLHTMDQSIQSIPVNIIQVAQIKTQQKQQQIQTPLQSQQQQQQQPTSSQSAPTLSMLLETKQQMAEIINSPSTTTTNEQTVIKYEKEEEEEEEEEFDHNEKSNIFQDIIDSDEIQNEGNIKDDEQQLMDVFNGMIPDNIDELADILTENNAIILGPELLEDEDPILNNVDSVISEQTDNQEKILDTNKFIETTPSFPTTEIINKPELNAAELQSRENAEIEALRNDLENFEEEIKVKSPIPVLMPSPKIEEIKLPESVPKPPVTNIVEIKTIEDKIDDDVVLVEEEEVEEIIQEKENINLKENVQKIDDTKTENSIPTITDEPTIITITDDKQPKKISENIEEIFSNEKNEEETKNEIKEEILTEDENESNSTVKKEMEILDIKTESMDVEMFKGTSGEDNIIVAPQKEEPKEEEEEDDTEITEESPEILTKDENVQDVEEIECSSSVSERKLSSDDEEIYEEVKDSDDTSKEQDDKNNKQMEEIETPSISLIDTDDDSPIEVIKEDKIGKTKRDYSRKKGDYQQLESTSSKKLDSDNNDDTNKTNLHIRMKLKDRERSESPFIVDDDCNDGIPRTRRRYSSTPNIDSVPNSPASSEDRDYKTWKKAILIIYNRLITHKYASIFLKQITEEQVPGYKSVVLRSMDLQTIKRNIDSGIIRTTNDFQRDVMLMCHNAIIFNKKDTNISVIAKEMMSESIQIIETTMDNWKRDEKPSKGRGGRKSSRVSAV